MTRTAAHWGSPEPRLFTDEFTAMLRRPHRATPQLVLLSTFTVFFVFCLHDPPYELHAVIHVVPTWIAITILLTSTKYFPLTNTSFVFSVMFLTLHVIGTRYVYSFVPYDQWATQLLGIDAETGLQPLDLAAPTHETTVIRFAELSAWHRR